MVAVGEALVSEDVTDLLFACDLDACKGACCVEGDGGAPLADGEAERIAGILAAVRPYLRPEGLAVIDAVGASIVGARGVVETPLVAGRECVYATFDASGVAKCGFEQAFRDGATDWPKPISCHLYPIRVAQLPDFAAVNYHRWDVCDAARRCGSARGTTVLEFCKPGLVRRFGEAWYAEAVAALSARSGRSGRSPGRRSRRGRR